MGPDSDTNAWMITGNNQGTLKPKSAKSGNTVKWGSKLCRRV